jgi:glycerol-3-phosphate acyltransferase PlsY
MLGHLFPIWLRFKGGKCVATGLGVLLALDWRIGLIAAAIWLLMAVVFRYSSLAALVASAVAPIAAWFITTRQFAAVVLLLAVLVWISHRQNIRRLLTGQEPKIGKRKDA